MRGESGASALDIGTGSGYLAKALGRSFDTVVATEISFDVLRHQTYPVPNRICCSGADALHSEFDLVVCNLPYLATDGIVDAATDGGSGGLEVPKKIIDSAVRHIRKGGKMLYVTSSLSDYEALISHTASHGLTVRVLARKRLFFEDIIVVQANSKA